MKGNSMGKRARHCSLHPRHQLLRRLLLKHSAKPATTAGASQSLTAAPPHWTGDRAEGREAGSVAPAAASLASVGPAARSSSSSRSNRASCACMASILAWMAALEACTRGGLFGVHCSARCAASSWHCRDSRQQTLDKGGKTAPHHHAHTTTTTTPAVGRPCPTGWTDPHGPSCVSRASQLRVAAVGHWRTERAHAQAQRRPGRLESPPMANTCCIHRPIHAPIGVHSQDVHKVRVAGAQVALLHPPTSRWGVGKRRDRVCRRWQQGGGALLLPPTTSTPPTHPQDTNQAPGPHPPTHPSTITHSFHHLAWAVWPPAHPSPAPWPGSASAPRAAHCAPTHCP